VVDADRHARLVSLLEATGEAHHAYERELGEPDPAWPEWYAKWLLDHGFDEMVETVSGEDALTEALVHAEKAYFELSPDESWQEFYATYLLRRYA
jgi:hypothetical protein